MKITLEDDDKKVTVYQNITDVYFCIRQLEPMKKGAKIAMLPETRSFSFGSNVRELVKELGQSLVELQEYLRSIPRGSSSD